MISFIKELWWFIKDNLLYYISIIVLGVVQTIVMLIPAYLISLFIKEGTLFGYGEAIFNKDFLIYSLIIPYILTALGIYLTVTIKRVIQMRLSIKLITSLRLRYIEKILSSDAVFFEEYHSGDLITRALGDVNAVRQSGAYRIVNILLEVITIVITFIAMLFISVPLTLVSAIFLPIIFIVNVSLRRVVERNWKQVRKSTSELGNTLLESITNIKTIKAFSKEQEDFDKVKVASDKVYNIEFKYNKVNSVFFPTFLSIVAFSTVVAYFLGSKYIIDGKLHINDLVQFTLYLNMISWPMMRLGTTINFFYESLISMNRLNDVYNYENSINDKEDTINLDSIEDITFKDFTFKYPNDEIDTLCRVSFDIKKGQTIGIVGRTGSGKSTLIRQLLKQFYVNDDSVMINGNNINDYAKSDVRSHISYVPQEHTLFSRSILDNILIGSLDPKSDKEVEDAILLADFKKDISYLSHGLNTIVGEYGVTLSGGQKQRLCIARAFLRNSEVLVLDDSLSAVDGKTEETIINNLSKFRSNKTNIIIAHRLSAVKAADLIIVIDNGMIIERGTHEELTKLDGWYNKQYLEQQIVGDSNE